MSDRSLLDPTSQRAKELEALLLAMYQQVHWIDWLRERTPPSCEHMR